MFICIKCSFSWSLKVRVLFKRKNLNYCNHYYFLKSFSWVKCFNKQSYTKEEVMTGLPYKQSPKRAYIKGWWRLSDKKKDCLTLLTRRNTSFTRSGRESVLDNADHSLPRHLLVWGCWTQETDVAKADMPPSIAEKGKNKAPKCWTKTLLVPGKAWGRDWQHRGSRVDMPPVQPWLPLWLTLHGHGHQEEQPRATVWEGFTSSFHCSDVLPCVQGCHTQTPPALLLGSLQLQGGLWDPSPQGLSFIASLPGDSDH